jgi:hypothetical protein
MAIDAMAGYLPTKLSISPDKFTSTPYLMAALLLAGVTNRRYPAVFLPPVNSLAMAGRIIGRIKRIEADKKTPPRIIS